MLKKKILVVDDDARNIFALTATLKAKSYSCVSKSGAVEAFGLTSNRREYRRYPDRYDDARNGRI